MERMFAIITGLQPTQRRIILVTRTRSHWRAWLAASLLGIASAAAWPLPTRTQPLEPVSLQLKWKHQFQFAGYYAALAKGYYREAGLDVKIVEAQPAQDPTATVLQGNADFGVSASDLVLLRAQGQPVVALAVIFQHSPLILLARRNFDLNYLHDLIGKRVMIEPGSAELLAYLQREGISRERLEILPHAFDANALIDGRVDALSAYVTDEPFTLRQAEVDYTLHRHNLILVKKLKIEV